MLAISELEELIGMYKAFSVHTKRKLQEQNNMNVI